MEKSSRAFTPPHCPNPKCRFHGPVAEGWRYKKAGFFFRQQHPQRIQRYHCVTCRRYFSTQTFHISYWLKLPHVVSTLLTQTVGCMANRQIAWALRVSPKTVDDQLQRLGRHCLLYHAQQMATSPPPREVVIDGFETFEHSQYYPFHFNLCVEADSDFLLGFTDSELRRKGRMTPRQRARRSELECLHGRPDPAAVRGGIEELISNVLGGCSEVVVHSDDHPAYPRALSPLRGRVSHRVTPGRAHRGASNRLFPVNLLDLIIRHCQAGHKRETIAFAKQRVSSALRLAILLVKRNYMAGRRAKDRCSPTPAMTRGMAYQPLQVAKLLERRLFITHTALSPRWQRYYWREIRTRALPRHRYHQLKYAF